MNSCGFVTNCQMGRLFGSYFYVVGISYGKTHLTCIWIDLSGFKNFMKYFEKCSQLVVLNT